jgi:hypothetical protein
VGNYCCSNVAASITGTAGRIGGPVATTVVSDQHFSQAGARFEFTCLSAPAPAARLWSIGCSSHWSLIRRRRKGRACSILTYSCVGLHGYNCSSINWIQKSSLNGWMPCANFKCSHKKVTHARTWDGKPGSLMQKSSSLPRLPASSHQTEGSYSLHSYSYTPSQNNCTSYFLRSQFFLSLIKIYKNVLVFMMYTYVDTIFHIINQTSLLLNEKCATHVLKYIINQTW